MRKRLSLDDENEIAILDLLRVKLRDLLPKGTEQLEGTERRRTVSMAALQFESFVIELLRRYSEKNIDSQGSLPQLTQPGNVDLVSSTSLNDVPPPIAFEIKFARSQQGSMQDLLRKKNKDRHCICGIAIACDFRLGLNSSSIAS